ncbi:hypothetical protein [Halocatena marina]|uniref:Phosphotyrosine protein phosphatase I domain-containing protein n=1 Tax=Halocatena marina TaxID=2934937 RepID=A0ABD5YLV1_9EURY|nr:hypothetical protein [Halocatena marina]
MTTDTNAAASIRLALCVRSAGRSQMAPVFDVHDWALDDPRGQKRDRVREIREEIEARVTALFDEIVERCHVSAGTNVIQ